MQSTGIADAAYFGLRLDRLRDVRDILTKVQRGNRTLETLH